MGLGVRGVQGLEGQCRGFETCREGFLRSSTTLVAGVGAACGTAYVLAGSGTQGRRRPGACAPPSAAAHAAACVSFRCHACVAGRHLSRPHPDASRVPLQAARLCHAHALGPLRDGRENLVRTLPMLAMLASAACCPSVCRGRCWNTAALAVGCVQHIPAAAVLCPLACAVAADLLCASFHLGAACPFRRTTPSRGSPRGACAPPWWP